MAKKTSKKINIKPLGDRVLVRPISQEEKTESGIIIPDTATKERPEEGEVLAVGEGRLDESGKRIPIEIEIGQKVMFTKYGPSEVKVDGEELLIVKQEDILAVIE
ncbi:MAG: co-chaperone GroES [Candidatus Cloacimonetes bacterium]|nr:co-chaperone GroES [Candidatus Cloacimonadota bacterium]